MTTTTPSAEQECPREKRARAREFAGYARGFASLFRAFPNDPMWGMDGQAEHAAKQLETMRELLLAFSTQEHAAGGVSREAIARVTDPDNWALIDHFRSKPNRPDLEDRVPGIAADSLAKADAISLLSAPSVPDGWIAVPREATTEMVEAGYRAHAEARTVFARLEDMWSAMLSASPTPDTGRGEG